MPDPRRVVLGVSIAAGAAYLQPATLNYLVTPMLATFSARRFSGGHVRETRASHRCWSSSWLR